MVGPDWVPASANSLVYNDRDPHPCDAVDRRQELDYWRRVNGPHRQSFTSRSCCRGMLRACFAKTKCLSGL